MTLGSGDARIKGYSGGQGKVGFLMDQEPSWMEHWWGMPEFAQGDEKPWRTISVHFEREFLDVNVRYRGQMKKIRERMRVASKDPLKVHFRSPEGRDDFARLVGQRITNATKNIKVMDRAALSEMVGQKIDGITKYINHPFTEKVYVLDRCYVTDKLVNPKYPVYIISKGRWELRHTSRALERMRVPYHIVIEPQEYEQYAAVIDPKKILVLPFSNLGQGSIPVRNWVWEHSIGLGAKRHWVIDDNIRGFYRLNNNARTPVMTGAIFRAAEDFVDRYENVAMSGLQYKMFAWHKDVWPPYTQNTRIYSCILLRNDIKHRWRGRYNEDTDLSLRILKDGWCTILFYAFLCDKLATMTIKGGNTDELYKDDGRLKMAESLVEQHPDIVRVIKRWGRAQHQVDYTPFRINQLKLKKGIKVRRENDDYGMYIKWMDWTKL